MNDLINRQDAERKSGRWNRLDYDTFHCLECGRTFMLMQGAMYMNYCPNCGADMRGEEHE